jgi:soluble lytic murein transglycosylase
VHGIFGCVKVVVAILAVVVVLAVAAFAVISLTSDDPRYTAHEMLSLGRYDKYDDLILEASRQRNIPPELIKAVIWRESRFDPTKKGGQGERGLMQITEVAAADWAKAGKVEGFVPTMLFDPKVNIEVGTWYLRRALDHWSEKDDPVPFALAEYNAGRGRVHRWMKDSGQGSTADAKDLQDAMDFPGTKNYIAAIILRSDFYRKRGEFTDQ